MTPEGAGQPRPAAVGARRRRPRLAVLVAFGALGVAVVALAGEGGLRWAAPRLLNPFRPDDRLGFVLKPDFRGWYPRIPVVTDGRGFRVPGDRDDAGAGPPDVLFVGDSVTFAYSVRAEHGFVERFAARTGLQVANAAVPGYNLDMVLEQLPPLLRAHRPRAVVYGLCLNDVYAASKRPAYEDIDPQHGQGGPLLLGFLQRRWQRLRRKVGAGPAPKDRSAFLRDLDPERYGEAVADFRAQWARLEAMAASEGGEWYVALFPFRQQVVDHPGWTAPQGLLHELCEGSNLGCLDPWEALRAEASDALFAGGGSSMHFSERGHELVAAWLEAALADAREAATAGAAASGEAVPGGTTAGTRAGP